MKKQREKQNLTYRDKTNVVLGSGSNTFYNQFLNKESVEEIINNVFGVELKIDEEHLRKMLNNIIPFSVTTKFTKLKPGKADKRKLMKNVCALAEDMAGHLDILLHKYGYDTIRHVPIIVLEKEGWKKLDTYEFLSKLQGNLLNLANIRDVIKENINSETGKKTGNNSKDSIPNLIDHLIGVYEVLTGKSANKNFQQDSAGYSPYKGQFYDFVSCVFEVIDERYEILYTDTKELNPFKSGFKANGSDESHSLGKYILKVFRSRAESVQIKPL